MTPYYQDSAVTIYHGDCREVLPILTPVDLVLTDPPYGLSLIGERHIGQVGCGIRNLDFFPNDSIEEGLQHVHTLFDSTKCLKAHGSVYAWLGHHQFAKAIEIFEANMWQTRFLVWNRSAPCPPLRGVGGHLALRSVYLLIDEGRNGVRHQAKCLAPMS